MILTVLVPTAGKGSRMAGAVRKQFMLLDGTPVIVHTLRNLAQIKEIDHIIPIIPAQNQAYFQTEIIKKYKITKILKTVTGGQTRQDSVYRGLLEIPADTDTVMIHDGVRPFIRQQETINAINALEKYDGAVVGIPMVDTPKQCNPDGIIECSPVRETIWLAQTPQIFKAETIRKAYNNARMKNIEATDDASLVELLGVPVVMVKGKADNIKITTTLDILTGEAILKLRTQNSPEKKSIK